MATVSSPASNPQLARDQQARQQVRSPLERLRGYIRTYITIEGSLLAGVFVSLVFWIGLFVDYGAFKAFTLDWIQLLPWWFRGIILGVLVVSLLALVVYTVFTRLFRQFSEPALALVLERRFPEELGDRLITAVELSDPEQAAAYGYSPDMVRKTIHDAAEHVARVPVQEVFDWARLKSWGVILGVLTLGLYLLVGLGFCTVNTVYTGNYGKFLTGFLDLNEVAIIWFERNILLRETIWPRKAHLVLIGFPESGEVRIGQGKTPPELHIRALKYVIAGAPTAQARSRHREWLEARGVQGDTLEERVKQFGRPPAEGWRSLTWHDLTPDLLGAEVPEVTFPGNWGPRSEAFGLSLDVIELRLKKADSRAELGEDNAKALDGLLEQLNRRTSERAMSRTIRKLVVPQQIKLITWGRDSGNETVTTLQLGGDNEYTGSFGDSLKESISFTVKGEDYYTATRYVTVVPPPTLEKLSGEEERPAYLYYRLTGNVEDLRGLKQKFEPTTISVQGGETSLMVVPSGTTVTMIGRASKALTDVTVEPTKKGIVLNASDPVIGEDRLSFTTVFKTVRNKQDFRFRMVDDDGVEGYRHVILRPLEDTAPRWKELRPGDIVRKTREGYMVTVNARVPFEGGVMDDHGLASVRYAYTLAKEDLAAQFRVESHYLTRAVGAFQPQMGGVLHGLGYIAAGRVVVPFLKSRIKQDVNYVDLPQFQQLVRERRHPDYPERQREILPLATVKNWLDVAQERPYRKLFRQFDITTDKWDNVERDPLKCDFPVWQMGLAIQDPTKPQPRYRMEVWLEASDQAVDSVPVGETGQVAPSPERFVFVLVSPGELQREISQEEEKKYKDLFDTQQELIKHVERLHRTYRDLVSLSSANSKTLGTMAVRAQKVREELEGIHRKVHDVAVAYDRILRELRANQIVGRIGTVENDIVKPLRDIDQVEFARADEDLRTFQESLEKGSLQGAARLQAARKDGEVARDQLFRLRDRLDEVLGSMEGLTTVNKLVNELRAIDEKERQQYDLMQKMLKKIYKDLFGLGEEETKEEKSEEKKPEAEK